MEQQPSYEFAAGILNRGIPSDIGATAARELLNLRLGQEDLKRVQQLADQATNGSLSAADRAELDEYEFVTGLIEILQSRARLSLRRCEEAKPAGVPVDEQR